MIARAAVADALILVRRGEDRVRPGDAVEFLRLS
jgi:molybdopterin biosynthesis enzyme